MEIKNHGDAIKGLKKLLSTEEIIEDAFYSDYDVSPDDWTDLLRIKERLLAFYDCILTDTLFYQLNYHMYRTGFLSEEDKLNVQKITKSFYQDVILKKIESIIKVCKTWKFNDYRGANFQREVIEVMEPMLDFFSEMMLCASGSISAAHLIE